MFIIYKKDGYKSCQRSGGICQNIIKISVSISGEICLQKFHANTIRQCYEYQKNTKIVPITLFSQTKIPQDKKHIIK